MYPPLWLVVPVLLITSALSPSSAQTPRNYADWISHYQSRPLPSALGVAQGEIKLVITAVEREDFRRPARKPGEPIPRIPMGATLQYGCSVTTDGRVATSLRSVGSVKGYGPRKLSEDAWKRLQGLLAHLPEDFSQLPPVGRRVVLQVSSPDGVIARVYDRANAPDQVLEILRLTESGVTSFVLKIQAKAEWRVGSHSALAVTPDGARVLTSGRTGPFQFWDAESHLMVKEIPNSPIPLADGSVRSPADVAGLTFSSNGSLLAVEGKYGIDLRESETLKGLLHFERWKTEHELHRLFPPQFTTDGRYLLTQSSRPAALAIDTSTLQRAMTVPGMPTVAAGWFPAPYRQRSVYVEAGGEIALWSSQENRKVARLDGQGRVLRIAWSPDESLVAIATLHREEGPVPWRYRVRVWQSEDGRLLHELWPYEQTPGSVDALLWSPDGRYILAVTQSHDRFAERGIAIWSAETGRHRGQLTGCSTHVTGLGLLRGARLVVGCDDGVVREWHMGELVSQVEEFEGSFTDRAAPPPVDGRGTKPAVFAVILRAGKDTVKAGEALVVQATLLNQSDHTITFGREVYHPGCGLDVFDETGAFAPDRRLGYHHGRLDLVELARKLSPEELAKSGFLSGKFAWISLKPGEAFVVNCEVTSFFDMTKPGVYQISTQEYRDLDGAGTAKANRITVAVTK